MLVEFKVGNYRSFREVQTLSLVASKDTELSDNCVKQGKLRLLKTTGIYGPNASGKSNLIKALFTMQQIIKTQAGPGEKLPVTPFKLDDKYSKEPSSFEVTFYHREVRYQYGFTATSERVYDEWLCAYPEGYTQTWFERKFNKKTGKTNWDWKSKKLKGFTNGFRKKFRLFCLRCDHQQ
jgi:AAA15 family ATPase/GTPase